MNDASRPFRVALVQEPPVFLNLDATVARVVELTRRCAAEGAAVVVFPETWLPGYPVWLDYAPGAAVWDAPGPKALYRILCDNALVVGGARFDTLACAAREAEVALVIGAHELRGGTLYNSIVSFAGHDDDFTIHRKLVPTYTERMVWGRGDGSTLGGLRTPHGVIGSLVCWEHWMPLARAAMHAQTEVLHVAPWPWVHDLHQLCSRHYAFEGRCFVAASGCVLSRGDMLAGLESLGRVETAARELLESIPVDDDAPLLQGGSALIGPDAAYVTQPAYRDPGVVFGEVDPAAIREARMVLDTDGHYSRPDVFRLEVDTREQANVRRRGEGE